MYKDEWSVWLLYCVSLHLYLLYYVCVFVILCLCMCYTMYLCICYTCCFTLDAGLLARSQYPEGPANGHLDTGFSWFPCVCKRMLRWFPSFQVATMGFSCNPPHLNFLVISYFTCKITTATG
jgi:hypothetical protein